MERLVSPLGCLLPVSLKLQLLQGIEPQPTPLTNPFSPFWDKVVGLQGWFEAMAGVGKAWSTISGSCEQGELPDGCQLSLECEVLSTFCLPNWFLSTNFGANRKSPLSNLEQGIKPPLTPPPPRTLQGPGARADPGTAHQAPSCCPLVCLLFLFTPAEVGGELRDGQVILALDRKDLQPWQQDDCSFHPFHVL